MLQPRRNPSPGSTPSARTRARHYLRASFLRMTASSSSRGMREGCALPNSISQLVRRCEPSFAGDAPERSFDYGQFELVIQERTLCAMLSLGGLDHLDFRSRARAFVHFWRARYFSNDCQKKKCPKENDTQLGACRASGNRSCVASIRASMPSAMPTPAARPADPVPPPHRCPGVEQRTILARTLQKSRSKS